MKLGEGTVIAPKAVPSVHHRQPHSGIKRTERKEVVVLEKDSCQGFLIVPSLGSFITLSVEKWRFPTSL